MDSPESTEIDNSHRDPEHHDESMSLILEEIDGSDSFSREKAQSLGIFYTLYAQKQREDIFREHPSAVVMGRFAEHLRDSVEMARNGDFGEVARFLRSEGMNLRGGGYDHESTEYKRVKKFEELAEMLEKSAA